MVALLVRGSRRIWGKNQLARSAKTLSDNYRPLAGIHAELDLWRQKKRCQGKVYVSGCRKNGVMQTTRPCPACTALLYEMGVRWCVFYWENKAVRMSVKDMIEEIENEADASDDDRD